MRSKYKTEYRTLCKQYIIQKKNDAYEAEYKTGYISKYKTENKTEYKIDRRIQNRIQYRIQNKKANLHVYDFIQVTECLVSILKS
jgi:hypothetical protein